MIRFKKVFVKDMFSYGDAEVDVVPGLYLLEGRNLDRDGCSNMAGKSALWDSLTTILYEKNSRGQVKDEVINRKRKSCVGGVVCEVAGKELEVVYERGNSNSWFIRMDGKRVSYAWNLMRGVIERELGLSYDEFVLSSWFQQGMMDSFLVRSDVERKDLFMRWLGLDVFSRARDVVKERRKERAVELEGMERELAKLKEIEDKVKEMSDEVLRKVEEVLGRYAGRVPVSVEEYRRKRREVLEDLKKWRLARNIERILSELKERESSIRATLLKEEEKRRYIRDGKCWVCGRELDERKFLRELEERVARLRRDVQSLRDVLGELEKVYMDGRGINREKLLREMVELRKKIGDVDEWRWAVEQKARADEWVRLQDELKQRVDLERLERLKWEVEVYRKWEKGFSDDGVVAYILEKYLGLFNQLMRRYGSVVGMDVEFGIGKRGELVVSVSDGYKSFDRLSYFSGSEKYLVMLVVMLGLSDFLRLTGKGTNLLVLDEVFAPFDAMWRERLVELLQVLRGDERMVVVITHHDDVKRMVDWDGVWVVEKRDGISNLIR